MTRFKKMHEEGTVVWRIYFFVVAVLFISGRYFSFLDERFLDALECIDVLISVLYLTGLFGHAFKKRFIRPVFWRLLFVCGISWDIFYNYQIYSRAVFEGWESGFLMILLAGGFFVFSPMYFALFSYGFRPAASWRRENAG